MVGCLLGGVLGALIYIGLIEMHHDSEDNGETGYDLDRIVISTPVFKTQANDIGKGNIAFGDGIPVAST